MKRLHSYTFTLLLTLGVSVVSATLMIATHTASAAPVVGFNSGNIIDDFVFTNASTMDPDQIQRFLNSKVPTCDTWGTQPSEFGGGTRAQWGTARGTPPPYTCLKDYYEGGKSAAQIIYSAAQDYQINPQILIVLLQKEQSLVTDTWPLSTQYRTATGYGCPDTAPCDSQYYGLTNQIRKSALMFRSILNSSPTWYTPYILGSNYIQYNPQASCGGSVVNIENRSTQALYNYTPYQPNQAALDAGYGSAPPCGAYGNRNFYLYFTDWFGTVRANDTLSPHPDGTVVSMKGGAFLIEGGAAHAILNGAIFDSNNYRWQDVKPGTTGDNNLPVSWSLDFIQPGMLYAGDSTGVYTSIYENGEWVKQLVSYASFVNLGYRWDQVNQIPKSQLPSKTSSTIFTSNRHPDGTLIKDAGGSVYYIDHSTRRYVGARVFLSQRWDWNNILNQTNEDSQLPLGANMLLKKGSVISDSTNLYIVSLPASGSEIKRPIGPWTCYANALHYTMDDVTYMTLDAIPQSTGPNVTCG